MNLTFDRNLFTQIGLDSGALTMLGTIVHSFSKPGQYRGVVHEGEQVKAVFTIDSNNSSANAQTSIDLASLVSGAESSHPAGCECCEGSLSKDLRAPAFTVNPGGYVLFHVSRGSGGYYVHVRRTDAEKEDKGYDSRTLGAGDVFTAIVLRPGTYSIVDSLTRAKAELVVTYPKRGEKRYQPPPPVRMVCGEKSFEPNHLQIDPGQGVIFETRAHSRILVKLESPDDGPKAKEPPLSPGRISAKLR
jgi:hypothetical protein